MQTIHLSKYFPIGAKLLSRERKILKAVDDVSLGIYEGEILAIVGESGSGKTTLARTVMRLLKPTSGIIKFDGKDVTKLKGKDLQKIRRNIQVVFQDPELSLDPRCKILDIVAEPLTAFGRYDKDTVKAKVSEMLDAVGLSPEFMNRYPRQLSGGQKQRISIARAMILKPKLVVLDEPTSALDASVQAQLLNLFLQLQEKFKLSYLLITHNIAVAKYLADRMAIMYCGNIVEYGKIKDVVNTPLHPYTKTLISAAPMPDPRKRNILKVEVIGEVPSAINPPPGCTFHPRCSYALELCSQQHPRLEELADEHFVACWCTKNSTKS